MFDWWGWLVVCGFMMFVVWVLNVSLILVNPPLDLKKKWGLGVPGRLIVNSKGTTIFLILRSVSGLLLYVWLGFIIVDYFSR